MNIIIQYDSSTIGAPAGFFTAVQTAVARIDALIGNNITITIDFGWGEVGGRPLSGSVGSSLTTPFNIPYTQVKAALIASATTLSDIASYNALPISDPSSGQGISVSLAQALALQIPNLNTNYVAGYVGLSSSFNFEYNQTASTGAYDAIGTLYHEISEVLGRTSNVTIPSSGLSILDLFRYSASEVHSLSTVGTYFSRR